MIRSIQSLAMVVILSLLAGCTPPRAQVEELSGLPEASLSPSGATRLDGGGHNAEQTPDGPVAAEMFTIYGSNESAGSILAYYRAELAERGWSPGGGVSGIRGTHEVDVEAWNKEGRIFRLGFWNVDEWRASQGHGNDFAVIFDARLIGETPDG